MNPALIVDGVAVTYHRPNLGTSPSVVQERVGVFGRTREVVAAVRDVTMTVQPGEVVGIVGANGSGKSSLLSAIAQQIPYNGKVFASERPRLVRMGRMLPSSMTGRHQIDVVVRAMRLPADQVDDAINDAIETAELGDQLDAPVRSFSKGMRSRLNFAALTVAQPAVLLIDEALAVGDRRFVEQAADRVAKLAESGCAIVICDHSAARLKKVCDRALLLEAGEIVARGHTADMLDRYAQRPVKSIA